MQLLAEGKSGRMVVMKDGQLNDIPLEGTDYGGLASCDALNTLAFLDVANKQRTVPLDDPLLATARRLGICFGDPRS